MNRMTLAALVLLLPFGLATGCATQNVADTTPMSKEDAMASAKRVSGPSTDVCNIPYDSDGDGINDSTLVALGQDADGDGLAVIPVDSADIFADGQYGCSDTVLNGFIVVTDATIGLDCDDTDATIGEAGTATYPDLDGDFYGDASGTATMVCSLATGDITDNTDCDDGDSTSYPGATEVADDGIDQDCDGSDLVTSDPDADGDGFVASADCDDGDAAINPDATEVSLDGVDNDCDGAANSSDTVEVCGAPSTELAGFSWQLWLRDATVYPDGNDDTGWDFPGYAQGVGTLCADFTLIDGNTIALNGPFDIDGDGTYGEEAVDGDGVWAYMDVVNLSGVTGDGYTISLTNTPWGAGSNGESVIDLL